MRGIHHRTKGGVTKNRVIIGVRSRKEEIAHGTNFEFKDSRNESVTVMNGMWRDETVS